MLRIFYFNLVSNTFSLFCNIFNLIYVADNFDKAWKKLLKARYMSDISSEESDIGRAKRKERAKKLTDPDFTSFNEGSEIPLPNICNSFSRTNPVVNIQLEKVRQM